MVLEEACSSGSSTDKILFPGTGVDVSLVISVILFVLCTVVVAVKRVSPESGQKYG